MTLAPPNSRGGSLTPPIVLEGTDPAELVLSLVYAEDQTASGFEIRDHLGNVLLAVNKDGDVTLQDAAGNNVFGFNVSSGSFLAAGLAGISVNFGTAGGISVHPWDAGSDALDLDGAALDPAQGAAMIVMRNPIGNMPNNFYSPDMVTINADLTAGDAKVLFKAQDTNGDVVTAELPLT